MSSESSEASWRHFENPERITIRFQRLQVETLDALVVDDVYPNRSKAIRTGIELLLDDDGRGNEVRLADSKKVTFYLPKSQVEAIEDLVDRSVYPNRSAAIRDAAEYLFEQYEREEIEA